MVSKLRYRFERARQPRYVIMPARFLRRFHLCSLDARRHVNRMCMAGNIPLVESGTAGYLGQVQPLLKVWIQIQSRVDRANPFPLDRTEPNALIASRNQLLRLSPYAPSDQRQLSQYTALFGQKAISCRKFHPLHHHLTISIPRGLSNWHEIGNFLEKMRTRLTNWMRLKIRAKMVSCPVPYLSSFGHSPRRSNITQHKKSRIYGRRHRHLSLSALVCAPQTPVLLLQKWSFRRCDSFTVHIGVFFPTVPSQGIPPRCPQPPLHGRYVAFPR